MRDLGRHAADARAVVRLRLGLLTWVAAGDGPGDGEDALARRLARLQQLDTPINPLFFVIS